MSWLIFQIVVYLTNINTKKAHIKPRVNKGNKSINHKMNLLHHEKYVSKNKALRVAAKNSLSVSICATAVFYTCISSLSDRANRFKPCRNLKENIRNATHKPRTSAASANTRRYSRLN